MLPSDKPAAPSGCSAHYTRSKALNDFKFAGVLPFCILHGETFVLLGAEPVRTGPHGRMWKTMCKAPTPFSFLQQDTLLGILLDLHSNRHAPLHRLSGSKHFLADCTMANTALYPTGKPSAHC